MVKKVKTENERAEVNILSYRKQETPRTMLRSDKVDVNSKLIFQKTQTAKKY